MTPEQKAAFINAQSACALCERAAMTWQNNADVTAKKPLTFSGEDFMGLIDKYQIGHNSVVLFFHD